MHSWTNVFRSRGENRSTGSDKTWETENTINYRIARRNSVTTPKTEIKTTPAETPIPVIYLKSFDKLPQWDFEDIYNQDVPPRPTVSTLKQDKTRILQMGLNLWVLAVLLAHAFTCLTHVFVFFFLSVLFTFI